jgi:Fe-Mn family superoxide dismutase
MAFQLPELPYPREALAPHLSAETIDFHYGKHHQAYVNNLNNLTAGTHWEAKTLEAIIATADSGIFNNAAQVWNHSFYWRCLSPTGGGEPGGTLASAIEAEFGGFGDFRERFTKAAVTHFGSGWAWLVRTPQGNLSVLSTVNADNPLRDGATPLLTCDVWEHAYYIDYRNARPSFIEAFWHLVNWDFVSSNLAGA